MKTINTLLILLISSPLFAQISNEDKAITEKFILKEYEFDGKTMDYRMFIPDSSQNKGPYCVVVTLHGHSDDKKDMTQIQRHPLAYIWARDSVQAKTPCIVISPRKQKMSDRWVDASWGKGSYDFDKTEMTKGLKAVTAILDSAIRHFPIDTNRQYVTGLSMGGFGTWDMAMRHPGRFAAIIPMVGSADPNKVDLLINIPIWTTHGTKDPTIPVRGTREIVHALEDAGKKTLYTNCTRTVSKNCPEMSLEEISKGLDTATLIYSEYEGANHVQGWRFDGKGYDNPLLITWLMKQTKAAPDTSKPDTTSPPDSSTSVLQAVDKKAGMPVNSMHRGKIEFLHGGIYRDAAGRIYKN